MGSLEFFIYFNHSGLTVALMSTQSLTEMSSMDLSWGVKAASASCVEILGASTSWNPKRQPSPLKGLLYLLPHLCVYILIVCLHFYCLNFTYVLWHAFVTGTITQVQLCVYLLVEKCYGVRQLIICGDYWKILNHFQKLEDYSLVKNEGLSCQYLCNCDETIYIFNAFVKYCGFPQRRNSLWLHRKQRTTEFLPAVVPQVTMN